MIGREFPPLEVRTRFDPIAESYARCRPTYPAALLDWIADELAVPPPADVLDIGCGTGIATRLLAARGYRVVGVDPSAGMLEEARRAGGGARYERGEAEATGLPDACVDLVVSGQAFHWFELDPTLVELRRVLRPGGTCVAFWNERTEETPFLRGYDALLREFNVGHRGRRGDLGAILADIRASRRVTDLREATFPNVQPLDRESLVGRVLSCSTVHHELDRKDEFLARLRELYDRHEQDGLVELLYRCVVIAWRFAATR